MPLTRRAFLKVAGLSALAAATGCKAERLVGGTPDRPQFVATPTFEEFGYAPWLSAFSRLNPELTSNLSALDNAVPDPLVKARIAEVLVDNYLASQPGEVLDKFRILKEAGQVYGSNMCGDSRIICKTIYSVADSGRVAEGFTDVVSIEQRSLGAAPRIFDPGINISLLATHCNSLTDPTGCGALAALAKLKEPGGADFLVQHGIDEATIAEIKRTLTYAMPDEQAIIAAKIQAMANAKAHGTGHITVATKIGHDGSWQIIGAFDETGQSVQVPALIKDVVAINRAPVSEVDAFLARGQKPFEIVLNATEFNTQDLFGPKAEIPGHTFKITARPQGAIQSVALNIREIDQAIAGVNYPMAHDWSRVQWVVGRTPDELALIRDRLFASDQTWKFLGRDGYIIEAMVNENGQLTGVARFTRLADYTSNINDVEALRKIGVNQVEVLLSQKTLVEAQKIASQAEAQGTMAASKWKEVATRLKNVGRVGLKILRVLQPVFDAGTVIWASGVYEQISQMDVVHEAYEPAVSRVLTTEEYNESLNQNPNLEPYLAQGVYQANYTQEGLANAFLGLVHKYNYDIDLLGGNWVDGPSNPNSQFFGMAITDLYKILNFDFSAYPHDPADQHKILTKSGTPLIFFPLAQETSFSPANYEYTVEGMKNHRFMILNPDTGEFLITGIDGEMIVPVVSKTPRNGVQVEYYLYIHTDGNGNINVKCVGYNDPSTQGNLLDSFFAFLGKNVVTTEDEPPGLPVQLDEIVIYRS